MSASNVPMQPLERRPAANATLRVITALVGAPLFLLLAYLGGWPFGILVAAVALIGQHELYRLSEAGGVRPYYAAGLGLGLLLALRPLAPWSLPLGVAAAILLFVGSVFIRAGEHKPIERLAATGLGLLYPVLPLSFLVDLRQAEGPEVGSAEAFYLVLTTFLLVWATDTFAYYTGRAFGRRPLAPAISPKKTMEGSLGGVAGAVVVAVVLKLTLLPFLAWAHLAALALIGGVVSQLGDLAESRLKRSVGMKDSGSLLPGHGGVLDRFDAVIVAAPLIFLYLRYAAGLFFTP